MEDKKIVHDPSGTPEHSTAHCMKCGKEFPVLMGINHLPGCPNCGGQAYYPKRPNPQRGA